MATSEVKLPFRFLLRSMIDRDKILVSKLLVNCWLPRNLKWLSLKSTEMTLIGSWAQWTPHAPARNV